MSKYRAYFVPGAVDPMGLQQKSFSGEVFVESWSWSEQKANDLGDWTKVHVSDYDDAFLGAFFNVEAYLWYKFSSSVVARGAHVAVAAKAEGDFSQPTSILHFVPTGEKLRSAKEVVLEGWDCDPETGVISKNNLSYSSYNKEDNQPRDGLLSVGVTIIPTITKISNTHNKLHVEVLNHVNVGGTVSQTVTIGGGAGGGTAGGSSSIRFDAGLTRQNRKVYTFDCKKCAKKVSP